MNLIEERAKQVGPWVNKIMDVDEYIKQKHLMQVSDASMYETSSKEFAKEGLYSETIFGPVGSDERYARLGYIKLNVKVIQPKFYENIIKLKKFYGEVMASRAYGRYDPKLKDIVPANKTEEGAQTGYRFFCTHLKDIEFKKTSSHDRNLRIDNMKKYKDILFTDKAIVLSAGLRDVVIKDEGLPQVDEINEYYRSLIMLGKSMAGVRNPGKMYDPICYQVQNKLYQTYKYIVDGVLKGKPGLIQRSFARRSVALASRNTLSPTMSTGLSPNDPQFIKVTETGVPLYQALASYRPLVYYHMKAIFINHIFEVGSTGGMLIDPKDYSYQYYNIPEKSISEYTTPDGIGSLISRFKNMAYRKYPAAIKDDKGKFKYLYLVYDDPKTGEFFIFQNLKEFKEQYIKADIYDWLLQPEDYAELEKAFVDDETYTIKISKDSAKPRVVDQDIKFYTTQEATGDVLSSYHYARIIEDTETETDYVFVFEKIDSSKSKSTRIYNDEYVRPLTYGEMLYIACYAATHDKFSSITRYPVLHEDNIYSIKAHLITTEPSSIKHIKYIYGANEPGVSLPHMPNVEKGVYNESLLIHPSRIKALNADFDGDQGTLNPILSEEAIAENNRYIMSPESIVRPSGKLTYDITTDIIDLTLYNMCQIDDDYHKKAKAISDKSLERQALREKNKKRNSNR